MRRSAWFSRCAAAVTRGMIQTCPGRRRSPGGHAMTEPGMPPFPPALVQGSRRGHPATLGANQPHRSPSLSTRTACQASGCTPRERYPMDAHRFDDLTKSLAAAPSRRRVVTALAGGAGLLALLGRRVAAAKPAKVG